MSAAAVARDRRSWDVDCAVSRSRACCMRPSRRPLRLRTRSSRARQPPSLCCAIVAQHHEQVDMLHLLQGCSRPGGQLVTAYSALLMRLVCDGTPLLAKHFTNGMTLAGLVHLVAVPIGWCGCSSELVGVKQSCACSGPAGFDWYAARRWVPAGRRERRDNSRRSLLLLLCWPSGARGLLHHNHIVCTQTLT